MYNNAFQNYQCPFCSLVNNKKNNLLTSKIEHIIYKDNEVTVFISSYWPKSIEGVVLIIPNEHFKNIFEIPDGILQRISVLSKKISNIIKNTYPNLTGIILRQNNGNASGQHIEHYHLHIIPFQKNISIGKVDLDEIEAVDEEKILIYKRLFENKI